MIKKAKTNKLTKITAAPGQTIAIKILPEKKGKKNKTASTCDRLGFWPSPQ